MSDLQRLRELGASMRVLCVEDDDAVRRELHDFLARFFERVDLAENGEAGLERYREERYDIVLSDINMPRMNGIEMSRAILAERPDQPIVVLSAYNEQEYLMQLINSGIQHYVLKPIDTTQLAGLLCTIAEARRNRQLTEAHYARLEQDTVKLQQRIRAKAEKLQAQQHTDSLTGLPNLQSLTEALKSIAEEQRDFVALLLIDIDHLQYVNELYGSDSGDRVLVQFANFLQMYAEGKRYSTYRVAGDRFVLMERAPYLDTEKYEMELELFLDKLRALKVRFHDDELPVGIDVTIGISFGQEKPFEHANMALRYAKERKKQFAVYNTLIDTTEKIKKDLNWKERIREAILDDRVVPVYHPIVDQRGDIVKYEALMRIVETREKQPHFISPLFFLDTAIFSKQYTSLSSNMVGKVFETARESDHVFTVNLSFDDISNKDFQRSLLEQITAKGLGSQIILEITESEAITDYTIFNEFVKKARRLGIRIAIDDFGSGYSNFKYILDLQPDYVKIDGSLIKHIDTDPQSLVLTRAITRFCHELGITVIAEYVHSEMVFNILRSFGVDEFQGFYFYEPMEHI